ncbi:hypothetical protein TWF696_008286 [Orbilia brochopaga]|uniref:RING-type domain-containing protein n=1 Tax=Orbilia brochopaga TaxID=3140254 RepID=A0AAV9UGT9_9PEZI
MTSTLAIPLEEIPVRLRCSMCNNLAQDAYRLPCCEQSICGNCQSKLPAVCQICDHTPLKAEDCKVHSSLRTTVTIFLRTAEKKYGSLSKTKKETTPAVQTPVEEPVVSESKAPPEALREISIPPQPDQKDTPEVADDKADNKVEEQGESAAAEDGPNGTADKAAPTQPGQGGTDLNNHNQNGPFWNNTQGPNQYPDQSGQYQGYGMGWNNNGYDQSSGYNMQSGGWNNGMQNMMDPSVNMNSFNGMQSFPDGYNGMGNMGMGYSGYGQGGSYGNTGMGMQGQGNWGNGWNTQNGMDGANFNSSGMNAGFYPGAGGYNHQSYGNHQSQQNHMMPHHQFQNRGYNHNQYRNYSNQNMRGNYGQQQQQQQFGGPSRGGHNVNNSNRNFDSQMQQQTTGSDAANINGISGNSSGGQDQSTAPVDQAAVPFNPKARGESSEKVLVDESSNDQADSKDPTSSMPSETNGAAHAISSIDIKDDSTADGRQAEPAGLDSNRKSEPGSVANGSQHPASAAQLQSGNVEQQPVTVPGVLGAPTGPRAMRERGERGRGRGRGGFFGGMGRGGYHQTQISGSDDIAGGHLRTGSITSTGKNGPATGADGSDYDSTSRRQSAAHDAQHSPVESRKDYESYDRDRRRSRSRSRSRTRKHRHHRSRSRKRSSSPKATKGGSRDRSRSRSKERRRHRDGDRDKDRDREKDKRDKDGSRSHRSSHKSSSHKHQRDRSRSRSRDRKETRDRDDNGNDIDAKEVDKPLDAEPASRSRHRDKDGDDRRRGSSRDDRKRDNDKKSRKRSRSRHRSHGHHKRSRGDDEGSRDRHGDDTERKSKSSRSSRRHSTRYEDEESAAERERRVEREREEERWGKR